MAPTDWVTAITALRDELLEQSRLAEKQQHSGSSLTAAVLETVAGKLTALLAAVPQEATSPPPQSTLPKRDIPALIEALRIRALALTGEKWERNATRDMMKEAADALEALAASPTPWQPDFDALRKSLPSGDGRWESACDYVVRTLQKQFATPDSTPEEKP